MRQGRYLKQLNTSGNIRTSFWQRQFSDDERVKVNLKKISIQRRSQEKGRERDMGVTIKYRGVVRETEKLIKHTQKLDINKNDKRVKRTSGSYIY